MFNVRTSFQNNKKFFKVILFIYLLSFFACFILLNKINIYYSFNYLGLTKYYLFIHIVLLSIIFTTSFIKLGSIVKLFYVIYEGFEIGMVLYYYFKLKKIKGLIYAFLYLIPIKSIYYILLMVFLLKSLNICLNPENKQTIKSNLLLILGILINDLIIYFISPYIKQIFIFLIK